MARSGEPGSPQWIQLPELGRVREFTKSGQKRIFAVVSRPIPTEVKGKTTRRVLVFDNHPDSLRLILQSGVDFHSEPVVWSREKRTSIVCGLILIAMLAGAMLWPLFW